MSGKPPFDIPPDAQGLGSLRAWFTDPPGAIVQLARPVRGTKEMAEWLVGPGFARLRGRFPSALGLVLVMDLSLMEGRDPAARAIILNEGQASRGVFARVFIVPPLKANPIYLTTLHAAAALLSAFGVKLSVVRSLDAVLTECPLRPARAPMS